MRLIDADAIDDVMMRLNFEEDRGITRGEYKLIDSVLFEFPTIEVQPEGKQGKWIPCSERLPEEDQYNLVTMQHANGEIDVVIARLVKPYSKNEPWEWESDDAEWTWSFGNGFAWMPLPAPYQAERKDV